MRRRLSGFDVLLLVAGAGLLALVLPGLPQALRAADADAGVHGSFTARDRVCTGHPGHTACNWQGTFRSEDGTSVRTGILLYGDGPGLRAGATTAARDIGRRGHVYMPAGSREWILSALLAAAGLLLLLGRTSVLVRRPAGAVAAAERADVDRIHGDAAGSPGGGCCSGRTCRREDDRCGR
jgi:hypothetical protein